MNIADPLHNKNVKNTNLFAPDLLPNRYRLDSPFELLHLGVRKDDSSTFSIFMANTQGAYYDTYRMDALPAEKITLSSAGLHTHEYYEFMFIIEGEIYQNIDCLRHYYPSGACCIVSPEIPHSEEYSENTSARLLFLKLRKDYISSLLGISHYFSSENTEAFRKCTDFFSSSTAYLDFIPKKDFKWQEEQIHSLFEKMVSLLVSPEESSSLKISLLIHRILMLLFDTSLYGNTPVPPGTEEEIRLFLEIRRYMESLSGKCTRTDLINHFHYSGGYLYKVVKNHSGLSIYDYNMRICMKKAAHLLKSTDMNINDIAECLGFRNYTQFYTVFQQHYFMTPKQYRHKAGSG